jgi:hypothetical protein
MIHLLKIIKEHIRKSKENKREIRYIQGYDFASGHILRGGTVEELNSLTDINYRVEGDDRFDLGIRDAIIKAVELGIATYSD